MYTKLFILLLTCCVSMHSFATDKTNELYLGSLPGNHVMSYTQGQYNSNSIGLYLDSVRTVKTDLTWLNPGQDSIKVQNETDTEMVVTFYSESMFENTSYLYDLSYRQDRKELLFIIYPYGMHRPHPVYGAVYYYKHTFYIHKIGPEKKRDYRSIRSVNVMDL